MVRYGGIFSAERIKKLDLSVNQAINNVRCLGRGSKIIQGEI